MKERKEEGRREKGEGRREKGEGRREKGEGRREKGHTVHGHFVNLSTIVLLDVSQGLDILSFYKVDGNTFPSESS